MVIRAYNDPTVVFYPYILLPKKEGLVSFRRSFETHPVLEIVFHKFFKISEFECEVPFLQQHKLKRLSPKGLGNNEKRKKSKKNFFVVSSYFVAITYLSRKIKYLCPNRMGFKGQVKAV